MSFLDLAVAFLVAGATLVCLLVLAVMTVACGPFFWLPWLIIWLVWRRLHLPTPRSAWRYYKGRQKVQSKLNNLYASQRAEHDWAMRWISYLVAEEGEGCRHDRQLVYEPADRFLGRRPRLLRCEVCHPYTSLDDPKYV